MLPELEFESCNVGAPTVRHEYMTLHVVREAFPNKRMHRSGCSAAPRLRGYYSRPVILAVMPQKKMSPAIDWNSVEATLERLTRHSLSEFGAIHSGETFYGFAFECNPSYGHAIPCLNTLERLEQAVDGDIRPKIMMNEEVRRTFDRWADGNPDSAFSTIMPVYERLFGLDGGKPAPRSERADALRWVLPLWKYCKIANPAHDAGWQPLSDLLEEAASPEFEDFHNADAFDEYLESFNEAFLRSVCRVAIRLKDTNAFDCLNRAIDFRVCVIDGEEATEGDWNRLNNVRSEA